MKRLRFALIAVLVLAALVGCEKKPTGPVTVEFWHAMTGKNGENVQLLCDKFNASQENYRIVPVFKGSYIDTMNAGIAAYRAGEAPGILQVFEVGTATMMAAKGAVKPVYQLMKEGRVKFDPKAYIPTITSYYSTANGEMLSMPFNSSTGVMYYNKDAFRKAGLDPEKPPVTWPEFFEVAKKLKASGMQGGFSTNWISWIQLENFSAWHNLPFGTKANGIDGLDTELVFNSPAPPSSTSRRSMTSPRTAPSSTAAARTRPIPSSPPARSACTSSPSAATQLQEHLQVRVRRRSPPLLSRRQGRSPELDHRRREPLGLQRQVQGRVQGHRQLLRLPLPARDPGLLAPEHRLPPHHEGRL